MGPLRIPTWRSRAEGRCYGRVNYTASRHAEGRMCGPLRRQGRRGRGAPVPQGSKGRPWNAQPAQYSRLFHVGNMARPSDRTRLSAASIREVSASGAFVEAERAGDLAMRLALRAEELHAPALAARHLPGAAVAEVLHQAPRAVQADFPCELAGGRHSLRHGDAGAAVLCHELGRYGLAHELHEPVQLGRRRRGVSHAWWFPGCLHARASRSG